MHSFGTTDEVELRDIIKSHKISCSPIDPVPSKILSEYYELFIPFWVELVNVSLSTGTLDPLKSDIIIPLLKELHGIINIEELKNFRPVSNLLYIEKLIERCVAIRLEQHMFLNNLHSRYQYGYKKGHSTELLLLHLNNALLTAFDNNCASVLLLLDLSAAFDSVDHNKLINILYNEIGITGVAFQWFVSFLKGRSQQVMIGTEFSESSDLEFGVPQGSILGPILFNIYTKSSASAVHATSFDIDGFADDTQLYKTFHPIFQYEVLTTTVNDC